MNNRSVFIIAAIVVVLTLLAFLLPRDQNRFSWRETYRGDSKDPYGTYVISELLRTRVPGESMTEIRESLKDELPVDSNLKANYVFIGEALFMDSLDTEALLGFVAAGNTAFISSRTIPFDLMFDLYYEECYDYPWDDYLWITDSTASFNLAHSSLKNPGAFSYKYITRHEASLYNWHFIDEIYFCDEEFSPAPLGYMNDTLVNFARFPYEDGFFYLHTTPIAFSNIQLLDEQGLSYAGKVFSHLAPGPVFWDEYSKASEMVGRNRNRQQSMQSYRSLSGESPLQYILDQPPLAWAWRLLLGLGLMFLIFRTRRRRRIIPVLEPNTNTSMEFIHTIGQLYFLQNNHRKLALQNMKFFQTYVREHYQLQGREMDEEFAQKLAVRSGISEERIEKILLMHRNIEKSDFLTENTLVDFHNLLGYFYKNCK